MRTDPGPGGTGEASGSEARGFTIRIKADRRSILIPTTPETIAVDGEARALSADTLAEAISLPRGTQPTRYSWSGFFPGQARRGKPYAPADRWTEPEELDEQIRAWRDGGKALTLVVVGTRLRDDVYISRYSSERSGGFGDITYQLEMTELRELKIKKRKRNGDKGTDGKNGKVITYTTKAGDTLQKIARRFLGSATKWRQIYQDNKKAIGPDPDNLGAGTKLKIKVP